MRPLRDQMIEDLRLRGRAQNTIDTYVRDVRKLVEWAGVLPAKLTTRHVRGFLVHLMDERQLSCSSHDVHVAAGTWTSALTAGTANPRTTPAATATAQSARLCGRPSGSSRASLAPCRLTTIMPS